MQLEACGRSNCDRCRRGEASGRLRPKSDAADVRAELIRSPTTEVRAASQPHCMALRVRAVTHSPARHCAAEQGGGQAPLIRAGS